MDNNNLIDTIKECGENELKEWVEKLLTKLNQTECQWQHVADDYLYAVTKDNLNLCKSLITVRQYLTLAVGENELMQFIEKLKEEQFRQGIFITTSSFSKEAQNYVRNIKKENKLTLFLIDGQVMLQYLKQSCSFAFTNKLEQSFSTLINSTNSPQRLRAPQKLIRVTFPDGAIFCDKNVSQTFLQTIKYIGADKVSQLGLEICHIPLVAKEVNERYKKWIKPVGNGWYVMLQSDSEQKFRQLLSINNQLSLNMIIELGEDFPTTTSSIGKVTQKKPKAQLMVTFPNGEIIAGTNATETFVKLVKYIGAEEIEKKNIQMTNKQLLTSTNKYRGQINIGPGKWLTIPISIKDKYKIMKVIGSITHRNFEITMI